MNVNRIARLAIVAAAAGLVAAPAGAASERRSLSHQGRERSYVVETPALAGEDGRRLPVVIVLHGGGGDAGNAARMTGFSARAATEGFIVIYPNGTARRFSGEHFTWNAGHCCGYAMRRNVDDVGFIRRLIDIAVARDNADPDRVYVTGMSNGALMAHRVGIELSRRVAAIAPVAGGLFGDERAPAAPVSALMINGALDQSIPLEGGPTRGRFSASWDGAPLQPGAYQEEFWAKADGCDAAAIEERRAASLLLRRYRCPDGREVARYIIEDGGHSWPGGERGSRIGDPPSAALNASDAIWAFFKTRRR
jgi:polyhydroxybutyrate depolymerase